MPNTELKASDLEQIVYFKDNAEDNSLFHLFGTEILERDNELEKFTNYYSDEISDDNYNDNYDTDDYEKDDFILKRRFFPSRNKLRITPRPSARKGSEIIKAALENLDVKQQIEKDRSLVAALIEDKGQESEPNLILLIIIGLYIGSAKFGKTRIRFFNSHDFFCFKKSIAVFGRCAHIIRQHA